MQVESTLSMQALAPKVKEMQAKYANDPERLQVCVWGVGWGGVGWVGVGCVGCVWVVVVVVGGGLVLCEQRVPLKCVVPIWKVCRGGWCRHVRQ